VKKLQLWLALQQSTPPIQPQQNWLVGSQRSLPQGTPGVHVPFWQKVPSGQQTSPHGVPMQLQELDPASHTYPGPQQVLPHGNSPGWQKLHVPLWQIWSGAQHSVWPQGVLPAGQSHWQVLGFGTRGGLQTTAGEHSHWHVVGFGNWPGGQAGMHSS
jgi:hypothetical protein